jgi:hypothetical protein
MVIGTWENVNSGSVGSLQLIVHNDLSAMHGGHLGNTSNGVVKAGRWVWLRVCHPLNSSRPDSMRFRSFAQLEEIFRAAADREIPNIPFEDLFA